MFLFNFLLTQKILSLRFNRCHFSSKVLGLDTNGRQEIRQRTTCRNFILTLKQIRIDIEQSVITLRTNHGKPLAINTAFKQDSRENLLRLSKLCASLNTFKFMNASFHNFCNTCLNSKVILCKRNFRLTRITVLCNQITGIASEHIIIYFTHSTLCKIDHFPDVRKMIIQRRSSILTSLFCLINNLLKIFPFAVSKQYSEFTSTPTFHSFVLACNLFKLIEQFLNFLRLHKASVEVVAFYDRLIFRGVFRDRLTLYHFPNTWKMIKPY